jgi:hypothetical protein
VLQTGQSERIVRGEGEVALRSQQALLEMAQKQPESTGDGSVSEPQKRRKKKKR